MASSFRALSVATESEEPSSSLPSLCGTPCRSAREPPLSSRRHADQRQRGRVVLSSTLISTSGDWNLSSSLGSEALAGERTPREGEGFDDDDDEWRLFFARPRTRKTVAALDALPPQLTEPWPGEDGLETDFGREGGGIGIGSGGGRGFAIDSTTAPRLFVGSAAIVADPEAVRRHGITTIINCSAEEDGSGLVLGEEFLSAAGIPPSNVKTLPMEDRDDFDNEDVLFVGADLIHEALSSSSSSSPSSKVLVACKYGMNRSVSVALTYALKIAGPLRAEALKTPTLTLRDAFLYLKSARPVAYPNPGFWRTLINIESSLLPELSSPSVPLGALAYHRNREAFRHSTASMSSRHSARKHSTSITSLFAGAGPSSGSSGSTFSSAFPGPSGGNAPSPFSSPYYLPHSSSVGSAPVSAPTSAPGGSSEKGLFASGCAGGEGGSRRRSASPTMIASLAAGRSFSFGGSGSAQKPPMAGAAASSCHSGSALPSRTNSATDVLASTPLGGGGAGGGLEPGGSPARGKDDADHFPAPSTPSRVRRFQEPASKTNEAAAAATPKGKKAAMGSLASSPIGLVEKEAAWPAERDRYFSANTAAASAPVLTIDTAARLDKAAEARAVAEQAIDEATLRKQPPLFLVEPLTGRNDAGASSSPRDPTAWH